MSACAMTQHSSSQQRVGQSAAETSTDYSATCALAEATLPPPTVTRSFGRSMEPGASLRPDAQCLKISRATWACVFPAQPRFSRVTNGLGAAAVPIESGVTLTRRALRQRGDNVGKGDNHKLKDQAMPPVVIAQTV
ncbi:hypothetical protein PHYSODRAFT_303821 [Phytophthora sojae]|uniref:Uncharacterized protein n=1 Tax=Phytophthora sojae (strain P6497) TaxID=1094619 RepID=G4ZYG1_PHYSP|nr:hypothetical protein PHYSODRAFT_303821 [Phytophthora sojae]EGZ12013.1 hypothetical protein PHYSODRAFT_303821 [Phytophthora sojae]|eukprot:XP_009532346.1 hypothetical protein PHYSODRAFT_303821 [Phytophthora sojae]